VYSVQKPAGCAPMKQWLTVEDISAEIGVPEETVRAWIRNKRLPAYKPGKHYLVKREDLQKFLEDSRTMPDEDEKK
jgi:excisionase family DNA binding protein